MTAAIAAPAEQRILPRMDAPLRNLGPATWRWLRAAGFADAKALRGQDPVAIGLAVRAAGFAFSLNGVYALAAAERGIRPTTPS